MKVMAMGGSAIAIILSGRFLGRVGMAKFEYPVLIMLATYYAGEYWDHAEDVVSSLQPSRFAGGSGVIPAGRLPRNAALGASFASLILALGILFFLWIGLKTGPLTLPLGVLGILGGFYYSTRPVRWVSRGVGELWIAFCYGWLPVAAGCYLQTGHLAALIHWMALPIGLSIFNVILLNEFPDYQADLMTNKRNLTVRCGRERAGLLYGIVALGSWIGMGLSLRNGIPMRALWIYGPVGIVSSTLVIMVLRRRWQDRTTLEKLCGGTIIVNLGTTAAFIFALTGR